MSGFDDAAAYLPGLSQKFEQNIRTKTAAGQSFKGWGQFISAESHHKQIGPYGTSAGILVRSLAGHPIDSEVSSYLSQVWGVSQHANDKYNLENVRLAFLILGLSELLPAENVLMAVRASAKNELLSRQKSDGSWGDWYDPEGKVPPSRTEPTSWCSFALARLGDDESRAAARRGATYLQDVALAGAVEKFDPFAIAVVCATLDKTNVRSAIIGAARRMLKAAAKEDPHRIVIYFFDYIGRGTEVRRDYLCVPYLFVASVLAKSLAHNYAEGIHSFSTARDSWKIYSSVKSITTKSDLFRPRQATNAATVDQSLIALGAKSIAGITTGWTRSLPIIVPVLNFMARSFLTRVLLASAVLLLLSGLATNPQAVGDLWVAFFAEPPEPIKTLLLSISGSAQIVAVVLLAFFGQSLVNSVVEWVGRKVRGDDE